MLIGLSGKRGAGKDTVASALVEHHGFTRIAFADELKSMLYVQDPLVEYGRAQVIRLSSLVDMEGWDGAKAHADVRKLLQRAGQWMFKVDKLFWVKAATTAIDPALDYVITDLRFDHERDWLRDQNGWIVRIERTDHVVVDADASEVQADAWNYDLTVYNRGPGATDPEFLAALIASELAR